MTPEISVIIASYNTEAYIRQALESVLQQTVNNFEIIVVDDASTDSTVEVAKSFIDNRIKVIVNHKNLGAAAARNRALREATGKWIALLDSDDWYAPERLEKLLQIASAKDADMIADDIYYIEDGENLPWSTLFRNTKQKVDKITQIDPVFFVETDIPGRWGLTLGLTKPLLKREFLVKHDLEYDESIRLVEDSWFYLKCLALGAKFFIIPEPYYYYRGSRPGAMASARQIERLEQYRNATLNFLNQDFVKVNPQLAAALSKRLALMEETKPYFIVVDTIKQREFFKSLSEMARNPGFFGHFSKEIPRIISRRINYWSAKINRQN